MSRPFARNVIAAPAAVVLIVATVALARLIAITTPDGGDNTRPWVHQGQMNEAVAESTFEVTVLSVRGARAYEGGLDSGTTEGLFLFVRARVVALDAVTEVRRAEVVDAAGNAYQSFRLSGLDSYELLPRIPYAGELLFEVPQTVATQLVLRLSSTPEGTRYQTVVEVPLEIDANDVDDWSAKTDALTVMPPEVVT